MTGFEKQLISLSLALLLSLCCSGDDETLSGHMQPLGSHMEPELVRKMDHMPTPLEFYEDYVRPKIPVVFEGLMAKQEVIKNWQSDEYLREHYGDALMTVEFGKKENRSEPGFSTTMKEFLEVYQAENIYMVSDLSDGMVKDWRLPRFMLCGGFPEHLMFVYVWFSSGGTKSVVHTDTYENLHCLISGQKKFVLIEPHYAEQIGPEHQQKGFFDIDVDQVNMTAYPNLAKIPWYQATVNPGDCLYLPYLWIHNVNSIGRNMGVNVWWNSFKFRRDDCPPDFNSLPEFGTMENVDLAPELQLREVLLMVAHEDGSIHLEDLYQMMYEHLSVADFKLEHVQELFDILLPGNNGVIPNIDQVLREKLRHGFTFVMELSEELSRREMQQKRGFNEFDQPLSDEEYFQTFGEEFGGMDELYEEDMWEGPMSDRMREGGGDYQDREHKKDEL